MKHVILAALAALLPAPAIAVPVTDCPQRTAPFSIDLPLVDVLASKRATALVEDAMPGAIARVPARLALGGTPGFGAILTLRAGVDLMKSDPAALPALDRALRALPVTAADRLARCARYDADQPSFTLTPGKRHILLFEKITGFRDSPSVAAAHAAFLAMAARNGWEIVATDRGGAFLPATLARFNLVIWNNISGDALTLAERRSFRRWMEQGGAFVGVHGSGGDPIYFWDWYADTLLGARFAGHPINPQFREAAIKVDAPSNAIAAGLPPSWAMTDEWYSFKVSPRGPGTTVIASLDESYLDAADKPAFRMGDHPIAWARCVGRGRMFYTAIGHRPEGYEQPQVVRLIQNAVGWGLDRKACTTRPAR